MTDWRSRWHVSVASNVRGRVGIGWTFTDSDRREVWEVFREDSNDFPVFSAARGSGDLPRWQDLEAMTQESVADLMASAQIPDRSGWLGRNVSAALLLASSELRSWEGMEWALEVDDDVPLAWATPSDGRTPFHWLRGKGTDRDVVVSIYQDDGAFGLCFIPYGDLTPYVPYQHGGEIRPRWDVPLVTGRIQKVEAVLDTLAEECAEPGILSEVLLHGEVSRTLLIAAEAYSRTEWKLYDESVVVLDGIASADALEWFPARRRWSSFWTPST